MANKSALKVCINEAMESALSLRQPSNDLALRWPLLMLIQNELDLYGIFEFRERVLADLSAFRLGSQVTCSHDFDI